MRSRSHSKLKRPFSFGGVEIEHSVYPKHENGVNQLHPNTLNTSYRWHTKCLQWEHI